METMDLSQSKLIREEWEALERRVEPKENEILKLIRNGYEDINIRHNNLKSLIGTMKMAHEEYFDKYFYNEYFNEKIKKLSKKYKLSTPKIKLKKKKIKKKMR